LLQKKGDELESHRLAGNTTARETQGQESGEGHVNVPAGWGLAVEMIFPLVTSKGSQEHRRRGAKSKLERIKLGSSCTDQ
jgi:hypothetical protein